MHAYRHCFASLLLKNSTDYKAICEIMGHSDINITQNIYNHTNNEQKWDVINKAFNDNKNEQEIVLQNILYELKCLREEIKNLKNNIEV